MSATPFEIWWLVIIPVCFAAGWLAARIDIKHLIASSQQLPKHYFKGLHFLLTEQADKAIDAFIEVAKIDSETVELHFALGNLFRRRGELERAIRVHQNLLSRQDLSLEQKQHALYELGQNYLKAGLLDRAEETLNQLDSGDFVVRSQKALIEIYQREKEWHKAIATAKQLEQIGEGNYQKEIAQFYCELAQDQITQESPDAALELLEKALLINRSCVRATILMGEALASKHMPEKALLVWQRVEQQNYNYTPLIAKQLIETYRAAGQLTQGLQLLNEYLTESSAVDLLILIAQVTVEVKGYDAAMAWMLEQLPRFGSLLALQKYLELKITQAPMNQQSEWMLIKNLIHGYSQRYSRYQCHECGFKARHFYWQCPGCHTWESYPPKRVEEIHTA